MPLSRTQQAGSSLDAAYARGDPELLYKELLKYVSHIQSLRLGVRDEDFVAEAASFIVMNLDKFKGKSNFSTWVFKIVLRRVIAWNKARRDSQRRETGLESAERLIPLAPERDESRRLKQLVKKLPEEDQHLVELRLNGLTFKEMGKELNCSFQRAQQLWQMTFRKLKELSSEDSSPSEESLNNETQHKKEAKEDVRSSS